MVIRAIDDVPRPLAILVTPVLPRPDGCGRALRAWDWVQTLSRDARVHVLVTTSPSSQRRHRIVEGVERVWWLEVAATSRRRRRLGKILPFLAGRRHDLATDWQSLGGDGLPRALEQALAENRVARIVVFRTYLHDIGAAVARLAPSASRELDMDDMEPATRRSIAGAHLRLREPGRALRSLAAAWQYSAILARLRGYDRVYLAAPEDLARMPVGVASAIRHRPNRRAAFAADGTGSRGPRQLLFVGTLNYPPNVEAVRFLTRRLMPGLRRRSADIRIAIVGRGAPRWLARSAEAADGVDFLGEVDDVAGCYRECFAALVPVWAGGGTKLKTIEAFARGMPVVSTGHGVRGLGAVPGTHYLPAETAAAFRDAIIRLAEDPALADAIARNGKQLFDRHLRAPITEPQAAGPMLPKAAGGGVSSA